MVREEETVEHLLMECRKREDERERCTGELIRDTAAMRIVE